MALVGTTNPAAIRNTLPSAGIAILKTTALQQCSRLTSCRIEGAGTASDTSAWARAGADHRGRRRWHGRGLRHRNAGLGVTGAAATLSCCARCSPRSRRGSRVPATGADRNGGHSLQGTG